MDSVCLFSGGQIVDLLEIMRENVGKFDLRCLTLKEDKTATVLKALQMFIGRVEELADYCRSPTNQKVIQLYYSRLDKLREVLGNSWNSDLLPPDPADEAETEEEAGTEATPIQVRQIFKKITPLVVRREEIQCRFCVKKIKSVKLMKRHLALKHPEQDQVVHADDENEPKVTCFCSNKNGNKCNKRMKLDQMYRHLKTHGFQPSKPRKQKLRGFLSSDGGVSYEPVFLEDHEEDPDFPSDEEDAENESDIEDVPVSNEEEGKTDDEDSNDKEDENDGNVSKKLYFGSLKTDEDFDKKYEEMDSEYNEGMGFRDNVFEDSTQSLIDMDETLAQMDCSYEKSRDFSPVSEYSQSSSAGDNDESSQCSPKTSPHREDADGSGFYCDIPDCFVTDQEYDFEMKKNGDGAFKRVAVTFVSDGVGDIKDKKRNLKRKHNEVEDGAIANELVDDDDIDSDIESSDSVVYTRTRIHNKKVRYENRSLLEDDGKLYESQENTAFIEEFKKFQTKNYFSTTNKSTSTLGLSCGYLFKYQTSLLSFLNQNDSSFNLGRLLDFTSDNCVELPDPDKWLWSVAGDNGQDNPRHR